MTMYRFFFFYSEAEELCSSYSSKKGEELGQSPTYAVIKALYLLPRKRNEGKSSKANEKLVEGLPVAMKRKKKKNYSLG